MNSVLLGLFENHPMKEVYEMYFLILDFTSENYRIEVSTFNSDYVRNGRSLIHIYAIVLEDFKEFVNDKKEKIRFKEFLKHSVENSWLNDSISKIGFTIKNQHIYFERNGEKEDWINMGEFYMDNYRINSCGSYLFLTDLISNEQFMYYGD